MTMEYLRKHWRGDLPFALTFWVNLVLLRTLIVYLEDFVHPPFLEKSAAVIALSFLYFLVFDVVVLIWQVRGTIKASDRYAAAYGSPIMVTGSHFGIAVCLLFTGFASHTSYQSLFVKDSSNSENRLSWSHSLLGDYTLTPARDNSRIHVEGDFRIGISDELAGMLEKMPSVGAIVLTSNGGRVTEGRRLAQLFKKSNLDTYVYGECKSACTTAFIGGRKRVLGPRAKLGFHQFSLDGAYFNPYVDAEAEQKIDLDFYTLQGIGNEFLEEVFQATHNEMWFPEPEALRAAGVIHQILPENEDFRKSDW